jgi:amino acid transporter
MVKFIGLVILTSSVNMVVFIFVNCALWKLHRTEPRDDLEVRAPRWCPPLAAACCAALLAAQFLF